MQADERAASYWRNNLRILLSLLAVWFIVSYLLGIVFVVELNQFKLGGFPLGFWFAQQGSIYVFILLVLIYAIVMDRLDARLAKDRAADRQMDEDAGGDA